MTRKQFLATLACTRSVLAQAGPGGSVWAVHDGEKVEKDDLHNPLKTRNSAWDGRTIKLFAGRNEVVAFQVIVEASGAGIRNLRVSLPELKQRGGRGRLAYVPPSDDPSNSVGRPIQILAENYMYVPTPGTASWIYRAGTPGAPPKPTGWKPVQLVPENARAGRGGFPIQVAPAGNQPIWIEIYTARDLPPGIYDGAVAVSAGNLTAKLPVTLEVFDFLLPDENSMHAMLYYDSSQPELYMGRNLDPEFHRFAHRHRVELVNAYSPVSAKEHAGRFRGDDFTRAQGYEGPGEGVGNRIMPMSFYGPPRGFEDRPTAWEGSDAWMKFVTQNFPKALTFLYMPDEPSASSYDRINLIGENVHSNPGPGGKLPMFVTSGYQPRIENAIDIWCSGPRGYNIARAIEERKKGRDYWFYNGGRPHGPAIAIESPATDPRAAIWACFKHDIRVYFYWHSVHWRHNSQKQGERNQDVWANPITFDNRGQPNKNSFGIGYGDGVLMYPGEEKVHPEQDRGIRGPCATIQLANFRRGLQDHQYLTLARKLGLNTLVSETLQAVVPKVFSDAGETVGFAENGDVYETARYKLAKAIAAAAHGQ